jgi:hypothetical protein
MIQQRHLIECRMAPTQRQPIQQKVNRHRQVRSIATVKAAATLEDCTVLLSLMDAAFKKVGGVKGGAMHVDSVTD